MPAGLHSEISPDYICEIMVRVIQYQRENATPVFLSVKRIESSELEEIMHYGYKLANVREVATSYVLFPGFRYNLYKKGWTLTSQKELESYECQELLPDGTFMHIDRDRFVDLPPEKRAFCYPGHNPVIVSNALLDGRYTCLIVRADVVAPRQVNVACVRDHSKVTAKSRLVSMLRKMPEDSQ